MRLARRAWCRAYQTAFRIALPVLPYFEPQVADTVEKVPSFSPSTASRRRCW